MKLNEALKKGRVTFGTKVSLVDSLIKRFNRLDLQEAEVAAFSKTSVAIRTNQKKTFNLWEHRGDCGWGMEDFEVVN
ncbi:MAG TPA: hypothetical protein VJG65_02670 [Patescibacteria group bacterium]|nr:hypothetical protein [Patescibacteria group bacterium]